VTLLSLIFLLNPTTSWSTFGDPSKHNNAIKCAREERRDDLPPAD